MTDEAHVPASQVKLGKIGQIAITVTDLVRAKNFYQTTLGMQFLFDAGQLCFFQCGDVRLMIATGDPNALRGGTILYFKVDDIHAVHGALLDGGVEMMQAPHRIARMPDHDLWMAFLKDPDGNVIGLMSELPRAET